MILDRLEQADRYRALHPGLADAFRFLRETDLAALPRGRQVLAGDHLYANVEHKDGVGRAGAVLEAHRRFIDVQYTLSGAEEIGWLARKDCRQPRGAYDDARDIIFFNDPVESWSAVPSGSFAIFFPQDAHAPLGGQGPLRKIVVKLAVDWPA